MPPGCLIGCSGAWLTLAVKRVPSVRLGPLRSGPNQRGRPGRLRALHASRRARVAPSLPRAACDQEPPRQKRCAAHLRCLAVPRRPSRRAPRSPGRRPGHRCRHRRHLRAPCSLEGALAQASTPKKKERGRGQPAMKPPARVTNVTLCDVRRSSPSAPRAGTRARVTRALRPPTNRALWALSSCDSRVKQNLKMGPLIEVTYVRTYVPRSVAGRLDRPPRKCDSLPAHASGVVAIGVAGDVQRAPPRACRRG